MRKLNFINGLGKVGRKSKFPYTDVTKYPSIDVRCVPKKSYLVNTRDGCSTVIEDKYLYV